MAEIAVNGETLHYERAGKGPPLLLIHSLGTGAWMWRDDIAHWSGDFDVIAFDARGHGASTHNGPVTVESIAADLAAGLSALGIRHAHVVGISMGGPIACRLYSTAPDAVASLVIADSFARQGAAGEERVRGLEQLLKTASMSSYATSYANGTMHAEADRRHFEALEASVAAMDKDVYLQIARSVFTSDVADAMTKISVPVRVVVGAQDTRTPPALSEEIARLIPHADFKVVEHAAHLSNLDNPAGFHAAVDPFLLRRSFVDPVRTRERVKR
ncbi:MAG: alpha/beta fold hydrolase [Rhodoblastus sp.]